MLFRPLLLPDELDRSYLGRIMRLNRLRSEKEAVSAMTGSFDLAHLPRSELSCLELLSLTGSVPLEKFAQQHSTIPLRRAVTSSTPKVPHGSPTCRSLLCNFGMVSVRKGAYFCAICACNDLPKHGVGYWRRAHQVPGQLWCPEHLTPLHYVKSDDAFLIGTTSYLTDALAVPGDWVKTAMSNEFVVKYLEITTSLAKRELPLHVKFVARALRQRAFELGLNTVAAPVKKMPLLSDRIQKCFPASWLANVVPSLVEKEKGRILTGVDGVLYMTKSVSSVRPYILAAVVLYESAEDALKALVSAEVDFAEVPRWRKRTQYAEVDSMTLSTAYVECNGHHKLIAERLALPIYRARAVLQAAGLPNLVGDNSEAKNYMAAAVAFHIQEKSFDESARIGRLTSTEMSDLLRCCGIPFKSTLSAINGPPKSRRSGGKRTKGYMPHEATLVFEKTLMASDS